MTFLLDTTYILPFFGIPVKIENLDNILKKILLTNAKNYSITSCSLIEAKWKAVHHFTKENNPEYLVRANKALLAFGKGTYFNINNPWFLPKASYWSDTLLKAGHKDYLDCWIAGTAKVLGYVLVTEDRPLTEKINSLSNWEDVDIFTWEDLIKFESF